MVSYPKPASPDRKAYARLMEAAQPPRQELIRRLNQVPGATGSRVALRADLLRSSAADPRLEPTDLHFLHLFASSVHCLRKRVFRQSITNSSVKLKPAQTRATGTHGRQYGVAKSGRRLSK